MDYGEEDRQVPRVLRTPAVLLLEGTSALAGRGVWVEDLQEEGLQAVLAEVV